MCCTRLAEYTWCKKSPSWHHRTTLSGYTFATKAWIDNVKKTCYTAISPPRPHNMANFGPLAAEIGSGVWSTQANFNGFCVCLRYCSDVAHRRPTKLCTMFDRLLGWYTIYTLSGALVPWWNFARCKIHFTSKSCVLLYWQRYCMALQQRVSAKLCRVVQVMEIRNFRKGCCLYWAGQPSHWALARILVVFNSYMALNLGGLITSVTFDRGSVFSSVCLFVCMFVSRMTRNITGWFSWNLGNMYIMDEWRVD